MPAAAFIYSAWRCPGFREKGSEGLREGMGTITPRFCSSCHAVIRPHVPTAAQGSCQQGCIRVISTTALLITDKLQPPSAAGEMGWGLHHPRQPGSLLLSLHDLLQAVYKTSTWAPPAASSARHKDIPTTLCTNLSKASPELLELRRNLATSSGHQLVWGSSYGPVAFPSLSPCQRQLHGVGHSERGLHHLETLSHQHCSQLLLNHSRGCGSGGRQD